MVRDDFLRILRKRGDVLLARIESRDLYRLVGEVVADGVVTLEGRGIDATDLAFKVNERPVRVVRVYVKKAEKLQLAINLFN